MKQFFLFFLMLSSAVSSAQFSDRKELEGNIKVPAGSEADGITIYNKNTGKGTVSSEKGNFNMFVKAGDSLYLSAVQYGELQVIVDEDMVTSGRINIEIAQGVNQLPEVFVRPHDLTGNINADAENIDVVPLPLPPSAMVINDYIHVMPPDMQSKVTNSAAGGGGLKYGANILAIVGELVSFVIPDKKKPKEEPELGRIELERKIRASYDDAFFADSLGLSVEDIGDFFDHLYKEDFPPGLLRKGKELDLLQFLMVESEDFRNNGTALED